VVSKLCKPLVITAGEPAGIGPEICSALLRSEYADQIVVVGDARQLDNRLRIIDTPFPARISAARPDSRNADTLLKGLRLAVDGCVSGRYSGMVTAPLAKSVIAESGATFMGHTEFLAEMTATKLPVMMLVADELRVALVSTHLPLREVADFVSTERVTQVLEIVLEDLVKHFGIRKPRVVVCGLNPHAGESGYLGCEDENIIRPAVETLRRQGANVVGPVPADTAFTAASGRKDAVLAMYHDQGLPVLKYAGFGRAVNVTLGLPIVRTSVDHGTAFDIAGKGIADPGSLLAAVDLAATMVASRAAD